MKNLKNIYKIDPYNVTNYKRTNDQLETFLLFCVCVAGKTAKTISEKLYEFLYDGVYVTKKISPFHQIKILSQNEKLSQQVEKFKLGNYSKIIPLFEELANSNINLKNVSVEELEKFKGIGKKTSRYFITHTRPNIKDIAVLDTHVIKHIKELQEQGKITSNLSIPKSITPKKYDEIESIYCHYLNDIGVDYAEYDLRVWNNYATK